MKKVEINSTSETLQTVEFLRSLSLPALPIKPGSKITYCKDYTDPAFLTPWKDWEKSNLGVGLLFSERYKMVDIDVDDPRAGKLSVAHLPQGGWVFGRKSKTPSHFVFLISCDANKAHQQRSEDPKNKGFMDNEKINHLGKEPSSPEHKETIIEYRGDGSQTVMPGTLHEGTGELVEWQGGKQPEGLPSAVDPVDLRRSVRKIAFTVMVADHAWSSGIRHEVSMCLAGMMALAKWPKEEAEHWFMCLLDFAGEGEKKNVMSCVRDTYKSLEKKDRIAGGPKLSELLSRDDLVTAFRRMFMDIRETVFEDLNARYAMVVYFSKVCIVDFRAVDNIEKANFQILSVPDFQTLLSNEVVLVPGKKGPVRVPKSKFWLEHPKRRTYTETDFLPGKALENGPCLNLWRGWAIPPKEGSIEHWREHMRRFICGGDEELEHWLLSWLADIVQHPMDKPGTAVLMRSRTRTGKNTFIEMMKRVIGIRYCREMNSPAQLTSRFNSHLQYALLVFANEAEFASISGAANMLKTLITDKDFHADHKHAQAMMARNFSRVVLASNKLHVVDRDYDDQRYTVIEVLSPDEHMTPDEKLEHFRNVYAEIDGDGPAALLHFLENYQYNQDDLRSCYQSEAGRKQILLSMNPVSQWWAMCLSQGRIPVPDDNLPEVSIKGATRGWPETIGKAALEASFRDWHRDHGKVPSAAFHAMFYEASGLDAKKSSRQIRKGGVRFRAVVLSSLDLCCELMEQRFPGSVTNGNEITAEDLDTPIELPEEEGDQF